MTKYKLRNTKNKTIYQNIQKEKVRKENNRTVQEVQKIQTMRTKTEVLLQK